MCALTNSGPNQVTTRSSRQPSQSLDITLIIKQNACTRHEASRDAGRVPVKDGKIPAVLCSQPRKDQSMPKKRAHNRVNSPARQTRSQIQPTKPSAENAMNNSRARVLIGMLGRSSQVLLAVANTTNRIEVVNEHSALWECLKLGQF